MMENSDRTTYQGYPVVKTLTEANKIVFVAEGITPASGLFEQGFKWLGRWDVIVPFRPYKELAQDLVEAGEESERLKEKIGDLRVPVFDSRLIFIKPGPESKRLWRVYQEEKKSWDQRIAFMVAVWETKPLIKPLPAGRWIV